MGRKRSGRGGGGAGIGIVDEKCSSSGSNSTSNLGPADPFQLDVNLASNASQKRPKKKKGSRLSEATSGVSGAARLSLQLQLTQMYRNASVAELPMPSSLSIQERAFVHAFALSMGLCTKSRGKGVKRYVTVYKRTGSTIVQKDAVLSLDPPARQVVADLLETFPITTREKDELNSCCERERNNHVAMGHLSGGVPQVPNVQYSSEMLSYKRNLPIAACTEQILDSINSNQVIVVVGETGSGKTTQIPQIILDQCQSEKKPCRIVCTQPRRISAVSVAERVAFERNEKIGYSIGYQIRLESRTSPKTVLTYCTNGVLLRTLMTGGSALSSITHVVVDEVHERDKFADFLLISLKEALGKFKDLTLILMSATIDTSIFSKYFNNCPIVSIPGRTYDVQRVYLDEILALTKYKSESMKKLEKCFVKTTKPKICDTAEDDFNVAQFESQCILEEIDPSIQNDVDEFLTDAYNQGSPDSFGQIIYLYVSEGVPVDCAHSETGMTGLMAAAHHGCMDLVQDIIKMGGDHNITDKLGKKAIDYAVSKNHNECVSFLQNLQTENISKDIPRDDTDKEIDMNLELYETSIKDDLIVDYDFLLTVIKYIHLNLSKGAILVFLTGYDDIICLRDMITTCNEMRQFNYQLYILHSNMQTADQKKVFVKSPNVRKIIISTNIAETSITIDDVVYVIDSGKVKEKFFESITGVCSLQRSWISKACAIQRIGRAGRTQPGKAFLMYSKTRYDHFPDNTTPEILRVPLHELCLHTKLLASNNTPIADYLSKAIEPPSFVVVRNSVALLKTIGALTPMEDLTEIGQHLLSLTIDPKLGKMLLYACILKCLDPILTIVCSLSYKDPFQISPNISNKKTSNEIKKEFSANSLSDHMGLLRVFQAWQISRANKTEKKFCKDNFINRAAMEMIVGLRTQLLAQLRAIGLVKVKGVGDIKDVNQNSEKWFVVKAALVSGLYPSIARIDREGSTLRTSKEVKLSFHPRSSLHISRGKSGFIDSLKNIPSDWVVYEEIVKMGRSCFIRCNTITTALTVALFGGPLRLSPTALKTNLPDLSDDSDSEKDEENDPPHTETSSLSIDDWIVFTATPRDAFMIYLLRQKFSALMIRRMLHPAKVTSQMDEKIISTIVHVLSLEERNVGLIQPFGIGQKPKLSDPHNSRQRMNDFDSNYSYENRSFQQPNYNSPNLFTNQQTNHAHFLPNKQNKLHQNYNFTNHATMFSNFASSKAPLSPSSGNLLLANIEKYANTTNETMSSNSQITRYFVIKARDPSAIEISQNIGAWNYSTATERKLIKANQAGHKVILFFSIADTVSKFFGYAEFLNSPCENELSSMHQIKWISTQQIPYHNTRHLFNKLNENRRVSASKDGQEICRKSGRGMMTLLDQPITKYCNNGRPIQKHN